MTKNITEKIQTIQAKAKAQLLAMQWPTKEDEEWRRSDPQLIPFAMLDERSTMLDGQSTVLDEQSSISSAISSEEKKSYDAFIAQLQAQINEQADKVAGVHFYTWEEEASNIAVPCLEKHLESALDKVDVWRIAYMNVGGVIRLEKGVQCDQIIKLVLEGTDAESVLFPYVVIIAEDETHIDIDIQYKGDGFFCMGIYADLGVRARCHINQYQSTSLDAVLINSTFALSEAEANFTNTTGQLGGMIAIDRVSAKAMGLESNINLNGYYIAREDQLIDVRTYQSHIAANAESRCLYHGLAIDQAHSVYRGLIGVGTEAVKTDAYLTNKNLLLSEEARMDSIPCLNILTNDVRCSHGSTTGTLNPQHIYYLTSRGLSITEAKSLLLEGFFRATFDVVFEDTNEKVSAIIGALLLESV